MAQTELLTSEQLARRLQVKPETIRRWGREGRIPRVEISAKVIRFDAATVVEHLRDRMRERLDRTNKAP